jgi:glyoxylase-like metal-dependent hydrolase (beta-lactamase superfamily II)
MVLSHAHPDHCWGTMRDDGTPTFPNAKIYMAEKELAFWERCTDEDMKAVVEGVQKHLIPLRSRIRFFRDNQEFLPGVRAIAAPGHTPGHTIFLTTRCPMRFRRAKARMTTTRNSASTRAQKRWLGLPILACA